MLPECGERWPTRSIRLGEAAVGWPSLTCKTFLNLNVLDDQDQEAHEIVDNDNDVDDHNDDDKNDGDDDDDDDRNSS